MQISVMKDSLKISFAKNILYFFSNIIKKERERMPWVVLLKVHSVLSFLFQEKENHYCIIIYDGYILLTSLKSESSKLSLPFSTLLIFLRMNLNSYFKFSVTFILSFIKCGSKYNCQQGDILKA